MNRGYTWHPDGDATPRPACRYVPVTFDDVPFRVRRSPAFLRMDAERARLADQGIRSAKLYDLASERAKRTGGDHERR